MTRRAGADSPPGPALQATVFVVGAGSLGAEIATARLLAPYFGASTIVWANTIACVLLSLSVGYWLGGRWADRNPTFAGMSRLVLLGGLLFAAVPFVARPFLGRAVGALENISAGAAAGSLAAVLALIAVPLVTLGAVSPYAVRLAVRDLDSSGTVAGRLYAVSTAGSLVGTFASALILIPFVGTHRTFLVFALALTAVAAFGLDRRTLVAPALVAALLLVPPPGIRADDSDGNVIYETETAYQYARVVQDASGTRRLELNEGLAVHSIFRPGRFLTGDYWDEFLTTPLAALGRPPRRVAILGNAGGTTARAYGHYFPRTRVDAVELDGRLSDIGRRMFDMHAPRLHVVTADARPFLRRSRVRYDAIFIDAYRQPYVPFYLATSEFFALVRDHLTPRGVAIVNVGHPKGSDVLEKTLTATMRASFPIVVRDPVRPTNTLLVAARSLARQGILDVVEQMPTDLRPVARASAARLSAGITGGQVMTDDWAPIEWLIDRSIVSYAARKG